MRLLSRFARASALLVLAAGLSGPAAACPVCVSENGLQIRAMLREDVWRNLAVTFAPVPALLGLVGAVRLATPWLASGGRADAAARRDER
jgi:hypothetical protein